MRNSSFRNMSFSTVEDERTGQISSYNSHPLDFELKNNYKTVRMNDSNSSHSKSPQKSIDSKKNKYDFRNIRPEIVSQPIQNIRQKSQSYFHSSLVAGESIEFRLKELEAKIKQSELKIYSLEQNDKNKDKIYHMIEEMLHHEPFYCEMQDRLNNLERIFANKMDKRQIESIINSKLNPFIIKINEIQQHIFNSDTQINQIQIKFKNLIPKIETELIGASTKYQQFIESNIIKSIDHINKLTQFYRDEIETFKKDQINIHRKIEQLQTQQPNLIDPKISTQKIYNGVTKPLTLIQKFIAVSSISNIQKQLKNVSDTKIRLENEQSQSHNNQFVSQSYLDTIYECLRSENTKAQIELQKFIYKLDPQFYLLDEECRYILNQEGQMIRLDEKHLKLLKDSNLI